MNIQCVATAHYVVNLPIRKNEILITHQKEKVTEWMTNQELTLQLFSLMETKVVQSEVWEWCHSKTCRSINWNDLSTGDHEVHSSPKQGA